MDFMEVVKFIAQYVLHSLLGGSSILAIRYNCGIEKKREILKYIRELINTWRRDLLTDWSQEVRVRGGNTRYPFMDKPAYWSLRPHLSEKFRSSIEGKGIIIVQGADFPRNRLSDEI